MLKVEIHLSMGEGVQEVLGFLFVCFLDRKNCKSFYIDYSWVKVYPKYNWGPQVTVSKENFDSHDFKK